MTKVMMLNTVTWIYDGIGMTILNYFGFEALETVIRMILID